MSERIKFEEWLKEVHLLEATWNEDRNCYNEYPAHLAYKSWLASRAVPDVPELVRYSNISGWDGLPCEHINEDKDGEYVRYDQASEVIAALTERLKNTESALDSEIDARVEETLRVKNLKTELSEVIAAKDAEIKNWKRVATYEVDVAQSEIEGRKAAEAKLEEQNRLTKTAEDFLYEVSRTLGNAEAKLAQYEAQEPVGCASVYIYKGRKNIDLNELGNDAARELPIGDHKLYTSPAPAADLKAENEDCFMINDGVSYVHPELGEGVFFTDDLLRPSLRENKKHKTTKDVRSLIIAAREVAYGGSVSVNSEEYNNLDKALEKFSGDVDWENHP